MQSAPMHTSLKVAALVVLLLMLVAAVYAGYISITHWAGIAV